MSPELLTEYWLMISLVVRQLQINLLQSSMGNNRLERLEQLSNLVNVAGS